MTPRQSTILRRCGAPHRVALLALLLASLGTAESSATAPPPQPRAATLVPPWHLAGLTHRIPLTVTSHLYRVRDRLVVHPMPDLVDSKGVPRAVRVVELPGGRLLPATVRQAHLVVRLPGLLLPARARRLLVYHGPPVAGLPVSPGAPWPPDLPLPGRNLVADPSFEAVRPDSRSPTARAGPGAAAGWRFGSGTWRAGVDLGTRSRPIRGGVSALVIDAKTRAKGLCYRLVESNRFAVPPARELEFGAWARSLRTGGSTGVYLRFYDAGGRFLGRGKGEARAAGAVVRAEAWQRIRNIAPIPSGAATASLQIGRCWRDGAMAFDDAFVRVVDHLTPVDMEELVAEVRK